MRGDTSHWFSGVSMVRSDTWSKTHDPTLPVRFWGSEFDDN